MKKSYKKPVAELIETFGEAFLSEALSGTNGGFASNVGTADNDIGDEW